MMKTVEPRAGHHHGVRRRLHLDMPAIGCILLECVMNAVVVIIADVIANESAPVSFIQRDDMIEQLAAAASDPAFSQSILPWGLHARSLRLQTSASQECDHIAIKL
jgi:hypothetical protein